MKITDHTVYDFEDNVRITGRLIKRIEAGLEAFNNMACGDPSAVPLVLTTALDEEGEVVAGLLGRSGYSWMRVDVVWVDERHRGEGLGTALLKKAEQIAIGRGCRGIHLDTHSFQSPAFYEGLGYEAFGELENYPGEHRRIFFRKKLIAE